MTIFHIALQTGDQSRRHFPSAFSRFYGVIPVKTGTIFKKPAPA
jgi:AraC-like DNA-binding protein